MKCHQAEGVNHYEACHGLVQHYLELLKDAKVSVKAEGERHECVNTN